jgi:hypothetical protein
MTNSTRFPKVIFKNAPNPVPRFWATHSVEYVSSPVSGMIAIAFSANTKVSFFNPARWAEIPNGTKMKRIFSHE